MDSSEINYWLEKYGQGESAFQRQTEQTLSKSIQEKGFADKNDVIEILKWKFATMKGRLKRELNLIGPVSDQKIVDTTRAAFQNKNETERIDCLKSIKGVGNAVCSVILTFFDPANYGIFDIHVYRELFGEDPKASTYALIRFLEEIRRLSAETDLTCREVEKAVFQKNYMKLKANSTGKPL